MKHKQMIRFMPKGVLSKKKKKMPKGGKNFSWNETMPNKEQWRTNSLSEHKLIYKEANINQKMITTSLASNNHTWLEEDLSFHFNKR